MGTPTTGTSTTGPWHPLRGPRVLLEVRALSALAKDQRHCVWRFDAGTFLASAVLVMGIGTAPQPRSASVTLVSDLAAGFREFTSHGWLWSIVLQFTVTLMGWFGAWTVIGPIVAKSALGGAAAWGWVVAAPQPSSFPRWPCSVSKTYGTWRRSRKARSSASRCVPRWHHCQPSP